MIKIVQIYKHAFLRIVINKIKFNKDFLKLRFLKLIIKILISRLLVKFFN